MRSRDPLPPAASADDEGEPVEKLLVCLRGESVVCLAGVIEIPGVPHTIIQDWVGLGLLGDLG